jgi:hypothetical protein
MKISTLQYLDGRKGLDLETQRPGTSRKQRMQVARAWLKKANEGWGVFDVYFSADVCRMLLQTRSLQAYPQTSAWKGV